MSCTLPGVEPRAGYTNRVRDAVLDRLLDDGMSLNRVQEAMKRDFLLELSDGFLADCLDWKVRQLDCPAYRRWTLAHFSGTLCVDEVHLGHRTLLVATDPIGDFPVAFALVSANDQDHLGRFLKNLRGKGFSPQVVVTDGSNWYPTVLAEVWPKARHPLCVFHVLKDLNACVFDALRRMRRRHAATGGRKRKRGRRRKDRRKRGPTRKDQAHVIWKNRYLITTRPENRDGRARRRLSRMFQSLPGLRLLREFVLRVYRLFDPAQSVHQAKCRRAALVNDAAFQADPDLSRALGMLGAAKFDKMIGTCEARRGNGCGRTTTWSGRTGGSDTWRRCGTSGVVGEPSCGSCYWRCIAGGNADGTNRNRPPQGGKSQIRMRKPSPEPVASSEKCQKWPCPGQEESRLRPCTRPDFPVSCGESTGVK